MDTPRPLAPHRASASHLAELRNLVATVGSTRREIDRISSLCDIDLQVDITERLQAAQLLLEKALDIANGLPAYPMTITIK